MNEKKPEPIPVKILQLLDDRHSIPGAGMTSTLVSCARYSVDFRPWRGQYCVSIHPEGQVIKRFFIERAHCLGMEEDDSK